MKLLTFVEPTLQITYRDLYSELARHLESDLEGAVSRFPPDEAVPALQYFRRQERRRVQARTLAARLGVAPEVVFEACTPDGAGKLVSALSA
ncbi:MAG: hypothetical protein FJZ01_01240 [Candidatus Sericytochromatia bacterium]|nr:hypothetical protein [Candidatus Tanganyikabacteria bacterium]